MLSVTAFLGSPVCDNELILPIIFLVVHSLVSIDLALSLKMVFRLLFLAMVMT